MNENLKKMLVIMSVAPIINDYLEDSNGFYKAVYNKDPFAMVIVNILKRNFSDVVAIDLYKESEKQLKLF